MLAAMTLRKRGGLVLLRPQPALAQLLDIMDADQVITVQGQAEVIPEPNGDA
jgi:anti-anti-sigma regulatory factor